MRAICQVQEQQQLLWMFYLFLSLAKWITVSDNHSTVSDRYTAPSTIPYPMMSLPHLLSLASSLVKW